MLMYISFFTPRVFSECLSAEMEGPKTSNNSTQQMDNGNHSSGNAHLLIIILRKVLDVFTVFTLWDLKLP